ncbi:MAG TPA: lytic transglycosylase domain-containing protein [Anaeromyxobacter sp.]|nr:lytic transglycosylase domain-containing protein [Anaeromyxobacter sp.]
MSLFLWVTPTRATARADEPLCDWLSGIGAAAQAQSDGEWAAAEGAARRALGARPRGAAGARAQAALGLALLAREAPGPAAESLEAALGPPMPARAHLSFARGRALLAAGDAPRAAHLFAEAAGAAGNLALAPAARLKEAHALLAAGLAAEAAPILESFLRTAPDDPAAAEARLALGLALRAVGDGERAAATLRALWLELPDRPEAAAAGETLAAWRAAGVQIPPEAGAEHAGRAERLLASGRPEAALAELDLAARAEEPAADPERAAGLRAGALLALGRGAEAERAALALAGASDPGVQRGARLVLARAAARGGRVEEAQRYYLDVASSQAPIPGLPEWRQRDVGDEAAFLAAWLPYDAGDLEKAVASLDAFARGNPRSRRAEDALWFAAWSRYRLRRAAEAERALSALSRGPLADAALYWRARLARGRERQKALYRSALSLGEGGWYALLARARLAQLGEPAVRPRPPRPRPFPEVQTPFVAARLSIAVELLGLGLRDEALGELRDLARSGRVRPAAALVAQLAAFAEDAELPFRMARDHLLPSRRVLRWAYPEPHRIAVRRSTGGFGVDPGLLLGVMRRESSFREAVRSGAGAEGLLQLRPATAERLGALLGVPGGLDARLADPVANITLGAHYLSLLLARFGEPAVAVAAYNAGPRPAAEWATARRGMPLDEWVECIPYRETRQYVKIVLAEWDAYRGLAGEAPPPVDPGRPIPAPAAGVAF